MRGYRFLKESDKLGKISEVKVTLTNTKLGLSGLSTSKHIFGAGLKESELITRQYLLNSLGWVGLNKALLFAVEKSESAVVYPMPFEWREVLRQHGFEVDGFRSAAAWYLLNFQMLLKGVLFMAKLTLKCIKEIISPSVQPLGKFVYFSDLTGGNLPNDSQKESSDNIVGWYKQWPGRYGELETICHSVRGIAPITIGGIPVVSIPYAIPPLIKWTTVIRLVAWGLTASALGFIDLFRNRWWHAFMFMEAAKGAHARLQCPNKLARVYLMHVSTYIYRPLWSYEAEKSGSQITCYFYSINFEPFKRLGKYPPIPFGFQSMNWPHYLVWDEYQSAFVRSAVGLYPRIDIVGSIPFHSGSEVPQDLPKQAIAVFDVQPMRNAIYQTLGIDFEYYVPKYSNKFLIDVQQVTELAGKVMVFKRKRNIGSKLHPSYEGTIKYLNKKLNCLEIDPDTAAIALIAKCEAVVSAPFTSTAIMGRELGKPSIYYDPSGICDKDDRAAHGIPILSGPEELQKWMMTLVSQHLLVE
jgi:polysaccharide biosynthesis PFTS motif protein